MTYKGHIKNGAVVLDDDVMLPEGSQVLIQPVPSSTLLSQLLDEVAGKGKDLPSDGSLQHDHYIYGTPKR
ncbi:MAG: hypothetical protein WD042_16705 [Phycisphaeraceae bacterium]